MTTTPTILVNDTVRLKVKFINTDPQTGEQVDVTPSSVSLKIYDSTDTEIASFVPTGSLSEYSKDYAFDNAGEYKITFVGILTDGTYITVNQQLYVSTPTNEYKPSVTLREDETIYFATDVTPLYIDPEEIIPYFPDASLMEIGELVHNYSHEVKQLFEIKDEDDLDPPISFTVLEYIKASAACDLSRSYGFGGDDELSMKLGDLSITNRSLPRTTLHRGNATTWCQIAASLRREILPSKSTLKGVVPKNLPNRGIPATGKQINPETGAVIYLTDRDLYGPGRRRTPVIDPMPKRGLRGRD